MISNATRLRCALLGLALGALSGCNGVDESDFSATPGQAPPDAPRTAEEYDARHPLSDGSADQGKGKGKGRTVVTEP